MERQRPVLSTVQAGSIAEMPLHGLDTWRMTFSFMGPLVRGCHCWGSLSYLQKGIAVQAFPAPLVDLLAAQLPGWRLPWRQGKKVTPKAWPVLPPTHHYTSE